MSDQAQPKTLFLREDFYHFGQEAGKAWMVGYPAAYGDRYLEKVAGELQERTYQLRRGHFPAEIISAWERGFWDAATEAQQ